MSTTQITDQARTDYATYGPDSKIFQPWAEIHQDFKLNDDNGRRVLALNPTTGSSTLTPWHGPKVAAALAAEDHHLITDAARADYATYGPDSPIFSRWINRDGHTRTDGTRAVMVHTRTHGLEYRPWHSPRIRDAIAAETTA